MRTIGQLWSAIERSSTLSQILPVWYAEMQPDFDVGSRYLRATTERVSVYPCPRRRSDGCPRRVLTDPAGWIRALCGRSPPSCDTLHLDLDDIVVNDFDVDAFGVAIGTALGLSPALVEKTAVNRTWSLGIYRDRGRAFPVYLTIQLCRSKLAQAMLELLTIAEPPLVVIAPTARCCVPGTLNLLRRRDSIFVSLDELLRWDEETDRFVSRFSLEEHLPPAPDENVFRWEEERWVLRYDGATTYERSLRGFDYIHDLIAAAGRPLTATDLLVLISGVAEVADTGSAGELIDRHAIAEYRERLQEVDRLLAKPEKLDEPEIAELERERKFLVDELDAGQGWGGRPRIASDDARRHRNAVGMAISRALEELDRSHPSLAAHLRASFRPRELGYFPERPTDWRL
jgi:hypothetical protein